MEHHIVKFKQFLCAHLDKGKATEFIPPVESVGALVVEGSCLLSFLALSHVWILGYSVAIRWQETYNFTFSPTVSLNLTNCLAFRYHIRFFFTKNNKYMPLAKISEILDDLNESVLKEINSHFTSKVFFSFQIGAKTFL